MVRGCTQLYKQPTIKYILVATKLGVVPPFLMLKRHLVVAPSQPKKMCNCRNEKECPLEGECLQNEIVYQATVTTRGVTGTTETYVGLTATDFKTRWCNHQMSFKHEKRRNDTELSKHLWKLKEKKEGYSISWKIIAKAKSHSNTTKRCNLCITDNFFILSNPQMATLNKRNELISNCRHRRKYILKYS